MSSFITTLYPTVDLIDSVVFKDINSEGNIYFSKPFLKAFETSNPQIKFKYISISDVDKNTVALVLVQVIRLNDYLIVFAHGATTIFLNGERRTEN